MNLNKIEDTQPEVILKTEWPLTRDEQLLASNLALAQALLCGMDELKHTRHFKQSVKFTGNKFIDEVEKHFTPLNNLVFHINADGKFNECVGAYEWMVDFMAKSDPEKFLEVVNKMKAEVQE